MQVIRHRQRLLRNRVALQEVAINPPSIQRYQRQIAHLVASASWAFQIGLLDAEQMERAILDEINRLVIHDLVEELRNRGAA